MLLPKLIIISIYVASLTYGFTKHKQLDPKPRNGWHGLISFGLIMGLLYWAGFFDSMRN